MLCEMRKIRFGFRKRGVKKIEITESLEEEFVGKAKKMPERDFFFPSVNASFSRVKPFWTARKFRFF